jgi:hypothetical protein
MFDFYANVLFRKGRMIPQRQGYIVKNIKIMDKSMLLEYEAYPLPGVDELLVIKVGKASTFPKHLTRFGRP